jgi:hypothetical protein
MSEYDRGLPPPTNRERFVRAFRCEPETGVFVAMIVVGIILLLSGIHCECRVHFGSEPTTSPTAGKAEP